MSTERPPPARQLADVEALKALAHPLRQRIQHLLRRGPATATSLARELGESTGATSYHLRQLARYGIIEELPERSRGRERWWHMPPHDLRFPRRSQQDPAMRDALGQLDELWSAEDRDALARFEAQRDQMGDWGDVLLFSRGAVEIAPEEVLGFFEEYIGLLKRYQRPEDQTPPGARRVLTRFFAFPEPAPNEAADDDSPADDDRRPEEDLQPPTV